MNAVATPNWVARFRPSQSWWSWRTSARELLPGAGALARIPTAQGQPMPVQIIGVPTDRGASHLGVELGPAALRVARLPERLREHQHRVTDRGDVQLSPASAWRRGAVALPDDRLRNLEAVQRTCLEVRRRTLQAMRSGSFPLVLGGDHSLSIGSVAAVAEHVRTAGGRLGVIWLDAHADMNTEYTTPSGNIHGMSLGCLMGEGASGLRAICGAGVSAQDVALIGLRSVDAGEAAWLARDGVAAWWMPDVQRMGMEAVVTQAIRRLRTRCTHLHLSFDVDVIDPRWASGVGTRVDGGLSAPQVDVVMQALRRSGMLCSMDVVEVNPLRDLENRTSELAVGLVLSALGTGESGRSL